MGCCSSRVDPPNLTELTGNRPGQPNQGDVHDVDLTAKHLEQALRLMAVYIDLRRRNFRIVVVGGVVSTMLLRTRGSTQDIDFFSEQLNRQDAKLLLDASNYVRQRITDPRLGSGWFNNKTTLFINPEVRALLVREGSEQNAPRL